MSLIDEYFEYQDKFESKYGTNTIVLMEVGSFFEIYGTDDDKLNKGRIREICEITALTMSKKKGKSKYSQQDYVFMAGFPNHSVEKWKDILIKNNYVVIIIEQDSHGKKDPKRTITEVISPGINIDSNHFSNNVMSVYIECVIDYKTKKPIVELGLSIADMTTGETCIYETHSSCDDNRYILDEVFRFIQSHSPKEIIVHTNNIDSISWNEKSIRKSLEIRDEILHYNFYKSSELEMFKPVFVESILQKVFPISGSISPVQYIGLDKNPTSLRSFVYLLQFAYEHNDSIISKLSKPVIWENEKHLILSHDSINQLNLVPNFNARKSGISSLWDILDKTATPLGKRYLKYTLLNPIIDSEAINNTYDAVEDFQKKYKSRHVYDIIFNSMKSINDIQRLHRKMALKKLQPYEFISLDCSYKNIKTIIKSLTEISSEDDFKIIKSEILDNNFQNQLDVYIKDYNQKIKMNEILGVNLNTITTSFFEKGVFPEIDEQQTKLETYKDYFNKLAISIGAVVDSSGKTKADVKCSDKEDYFLTLTKSKGKLLSDLIKKNPKKTIHFSNDKFSYTLGDLELKNTTTQCKIFSGDIKQNSYSRISLENRVKNMCVTQFTNLAYDYYTQYTQLLDSVCSFVARVDYLCCVSKVSLLNGYVKPIIDNSEVNSFINAEDLRHPIIEKLNENVKYIPNDVLLGTQNQNGILLYGVNAVGKSSYMKSIGLSVIMAQAGFYVPAKSFTYKPYKHLFTRISGNDNIFKNQSTFAVEMDELRTILKRGNNFSLVLGDELCSGTETTSGLALVTAGVVRLSILKSSFIFATHLHKLSDMPEITECKDVNNYHMETIYNETTEELIYNRKLKAGAGNSIYGLEVAKAMKLDDEFLKIANKVRKRIMNISDTIVETNSSVYNSNKLIQNCEICGCKAEEVHHIKEQHTADENGMIENFHKNSLHNLVSLCHNCHHEVHHDKLFIDGYINTSNGIKLVYSYKELSGNASGEVKKKKFSPDQIDIIKDIYSKIKVYSQTRTYLENNNEIKISTATLKKIVTDSY